MFSFKTAIINRLLQAVIFRKKAKDPQICWLLQR